MTTIERLKAKWEKRSIERRKKSIKTMLVVIFAELTIIISMIPWR